MIPRKPCTYLWAQLTPATKLPLGSRAYSTNNPQSTIQSTTTSTLSPRWLSDAKARIGKCITFGMPPALVEEAGGVLRDLGADWRELLAGCEGFLTSRQRAGLHRQAVVWGEEDHMGHVNNVMYVRYAESGRCNWTLNYAKYFDRANRKQWEEMLSARNIGLILKSITVDFKFPMTWPDRISVYHKIKSRPDESTDSLFLDVMILSEAKQRPAARCLEDLVIYDYKKGKKSALPPFMLDQFQHTFDLQEEARIRNTARIEDILSKIREMETQTWDRPDAREDFGNAG